MKRTKKAIATFAACALVGAMAIGGTFAYLTDNESAENKFTIGKVQIDLTEPNFPGKDGSNVEDLVPNQEVNKDPQVTNTGVNDAIIFMTVEVPVKDVTLVASDGTKGTKEPTELFWFKQSTDAKGTFANNFDTNWIHLTTKDSEGTTDGSTTKYVFAYNSKVAADGKTEPLFDKVQLKNIIENEVTPGAVQKINIKTYAIQASEILEDDTDLANGTLTETNLNKIYDIYVNQNSDAATKEAASNNQFDLAGETLPAVTP